ncbi:MAG TPA: hypothetical protein VIY68_08020, partial [Steroidobacteraceae bacterium]
CAKDGEISRLVEHHRCGIVVEPGDADGLANTIVQLSRDAEMRDLMGRNARAMLDNNFTRSRALASWQNVVANVGSSTALP